MLLKLDWSQIFSFGKELNDILLIEVSENIDAEREVTCFMPLFSYLVCGMMIWNCLLQRGNENDMCIFSIYLYACILPCILYIA